MKITVQLFASLRDAVGARELEIEAPESATPFQIAERLALQFPKLAPHLPSISFAVDGEFVPADVSLQQVKELALLPPVSGG
ncbi:MoaD/ThiS family protein [bacterium]|nr:MoaD/ThiS family protein [bacterium]